MTLTNKQINIIKELIKEDIKKLENYMGDMENVIVNLLHMKVTQRKHMMKYGSKYAT